MTQNEYLKILEDAELTQSRVGEALSASNVTGRRWGSGMSPIPKCAAIVLRLIKAGKITIEDVEAAGVEPKRRRLTP